MEYPPPPLEATNKWCVYRLFLLWQSGSHGNFAFHILKIDHMCFLVAFAGPVVAKTFTVFSYFSAPWGRYIVAKPRLCPLFCWCGLDGMFVWVYLKRRESQLYSIFLPSTPKACLFSNALVARWLLWCGYGKSQQSFDVVTTSPPSYELPLCPYFSLIANVIDFVLPFICVSMVWSPCGIAIAVLFL